MSAPACPACGIALEERRELGSITEPGGAIEHARYECGGCRAIVGRDFRLPPGGARAGRTPSQDPPSLVFTGASVVRALEPLEARARNADRAGILDELRTLQRDEEKQLLSSTEAVQRHVRGIALTLARHAAIPVLYRPSGVIGGRALQGLYRETRPRMVPARLQEELGLTDEELEAGGTVLPPPGAVVIGGVVTEVLLVLARSRLVADGAEPGMLRVRPPPPAPALRDWGSIDSLLVDLNLVTIA